MEKIITTFQLRAGRAVLGIGVREIGSCIGVSGAAISIWEHKDNTDNLKTSDENIILLQKFFEERKIFFPNESSISLTLNTGITDENYTNDTSSLTRFQLRAARVALNLTQSELARRIGVSRELITRAERLNNTDYIRPKEVGVATQIRSWFEKHNICFNNKLSLSLLKSQ